MEPLNGPIPGENFTRDTKNYPWHRPPEFTDMDKAIEMIGKKLMSETSANGILTMIENGATIADLAQVFLMSGIAAGKWTLDFALMLAGPTAHIMYLMAKAEGIDCDLGIDTKNIPITKAFFDGVKGTKDAVNANVPDPVATVQAAAKSSGFMGMKPPATNGEY